MIKKFHVLYVGQIELDNIGLNGTPANDRRYSDERLREVFATVKDVAQTMDELNFDVLWMAEHHFQREAIRRLDLENVHALLGRSEVLEPQRHAGVVARRWTPPRGCQARPSGRTPRPAGAGNSDRNRRTAHHRRRLTGRP